VEESGESSTKKNRAAKKKQDAWLLANRWWVEYWMPLQWAAATGDLKELRYELQNTRTDPNTTLQKPFPTSSALDWAAATGHLNCVIELLKSGKVDPFSRPNSEHLSVETRAAVAGHGEVCQFLEALKQQLAGVWAEMSFEEREAVDQGDCDDDVAPAGPNPLARSPPAQQAMAPGEPCPPGVGTTTTTSTATNSTRTSSPSSSSSADEETSSVVGEITNGGGEGEDPLHSLVVDGTFAGSYGVVEYSRHGGVVVGRPARDE
jgi:hypothetical protein